VSKPKGARRIFLGSELVGSVDKLPSRVEVDDDDPERPPSPRDLGQVARLARLAGRGVFDYVSIDDSLAGNPPFSGRRRGGLDSLRLATRLAPATSGVYLVPLVRANRVEPSGLLEALVGLEIASSGRHGWELGWQPARPTAGHSAELLTAIVADTWSDSHPATSLAASARAFRRQRLDRSRPPGEADAAPARPPVQFMRGDEPGATALVGQRANVARVAAASPEDASAKRASLRDAAAHVGRDPDGVKVVLDLTVALAEDAAQAEARKDLAEEITGQRLGGDGLRFVGTPAALAGACAEWVADESCDGFTFLPTSLPVDLMLLVGGVTPALTAAGHRPAAYDQDQSRAVAAPRAVPVAP
jgi:alkanesulfonate monooxygenase SsuD/methylene tetrahydromethanopterin reductase-like flavin-dependent oxidoreductase (luciferase family)